MMRLAVALQAVDAYWAAASGKIVVAPQRDAQPPAAWLDVANGATTDPLLTYDTQAQDAAPAILAAAFYDFPDLSTPYLASATNAAAQANLVANALAVSQVINEFTTGEAEFRTDWVFSLPTRRYGVAIDYSATGNEADNAIVFNPSSAFFTAANAKLSRASGVPLVQISLNGSYWNKEEGNSASRQGAVISPGTSEGLPYISGEANVFTFNGHAPDSILGGAIAYNNIAPQIAGAAVASGWANFTLTRPSGATTIGLVGPL